MNNGAYIIYMIIGFFSVPLSVNLEKGKVG